MSVDFTRLSLDRPMQRERPSMQALTPNDKAKLDVEEGLRRFNPDHKWGKLYEEETYSKNSTSSEDKNREPLLDDSHKKAILETLLFGSKNTTHVNNSVIDEIEEFIFEDSEEEKWEKIEVKWGPKEAAPIEKNMHIEMESLRLDFPKSQNIINHLKGYSWGNNNLDDEIINYIGVVFSRLKVPVDRLDRCVTDCLKDLSRQEVSFVDVDVVDLKNNLINRLADCADRSALVYKEIIPIKKIKNELRATEVASAAAAAAEVDVAPSPPLNDPYSTCIRELEDQAHKIESMVSELEQEIQKNDGKSSKRIIHSGLNWGEFASKVGASLVNSGVEYLTERNEMKKVSSNVRDFVKRYEKEKARLDEIIPSDPEELRQELFGFMENLQRKGAIAHSFEDLKKAGEELSSSLKHLKETKASLAVESNMLEKDKESLDSKEAKYKRALKKALDSGKRAGKKLGIFSTILNSAGTVCTLFPGTQILGASLLAVTNGASSLIKQNTSKHLDKKIHNAQGRLTDLLEERGHINERLKVIASTVSDIDKAQVAIDNWLLSSDSVDHLTVEDRFANLDRIVNESHQKLTQVEDKINAKQNEIKSLESLLDAPQQYRFKNFDNCSAQELNHHQGCICGICGRKKMQAKLNSLKEEKKSLEEGPKSELQLAKLDVKEKEEILRAEGRLNHLYQRRQEIYHQFEEKRSDAERAFSENMQIYRSGQMAKRAHIGNLIQSFGELSGLIYNSTGNPVLSHLHGFIHHAETFNILFDQVREAKLNFNAFKTNRDGSLIEGDIFDLGKENLVNGAIVPLMRLSSSLFGMGMALKGIYCFVSKYGVRQKTELEVYHEALKQEFLQFLESIDVRFKRASVEQASQHKEVIEHITKTRQELFLFSRELILKLDGTREEIIQEFKEDRFYVEREKVRAKIEEIELNGRVFASLPKKTEKDWFSFLTFIDTWLDASRTDRWNGFEVLNSLSSEAELQWRPTVDLKKVYQEPTFFTGVIAKALKVKKNFANAAILQVLSRALNKVYPKDESVQEDVQKKIEAISEKIAQASKELRSLFDCIPSLIASLQQEQKKLLVKISHNRQQTILEKNTYRIREMNKSLEEFKSSGNMLTLKDRFFIHRLISQTVVELFPDFDFKKNLNRGTLNSSETIKSNVRWAATDGVLLTAACVAAAGTGLLSFVAPAILLTPRCFFYTVRDPGNTITKLAETSFRTLAMTASIPKDPHSSTVSYGRLDKPDQVIRCGIDLRRKKIVPIKGNDLTQSIYPFLRLEAKVRLQQYGFTNENISISLDENALMDKALLQRVAWQYHYPNIESMESMETYGEKYLKIIETQIKSKNPHISFMGCESEFLNNLDRNFLPLAFPKKLLEEFEKELAVEISFVENGRFGHFSPYYEFSPTNGTLSIVYSFFQKGSEIGTPYCKFLIAKFDFATLRSYQKEIANDQGLIINDLKVENEFLLTAMYGSSGLPSNSTVVLANGLVAPEDNHFPGILKIFDADPNVTINFDSAKYTSSEANDLLKWALEKDANKVPSILSKGRAQASYYPDSSDIWLKINQGNKALSINNQYAEKYFLLMSLIKHLSCCDNKSMLNALEGSFLIFPPLSNIDALKNFTEADLAEKIDVDTFMDLLRESPSEAVIIG